MTEENTSEKKSLHPLMLFCLSTVLAFAAGVFTGVIIIPQFEETPSASQTLVIESSAEESSEDSSPMEDGAADIEEEQNAQTKENKALSRYKDMLKKSVDESAESDEFFKSYGVFVGSYTDRDKANSAAIDLKSQYNWEAAVYPMDNFYKVIIGPFDNQKTVQEFFDQMPKISKFIAAKIVEFPSK